MSNYGLVKRYESLVNTGQLKPVRELIKADLEKSTVNSLNFSGSMNNIDNLTDKTVKGLIQHLYRESETGSMYDSDIRRAKSLSKIFGKNDEERKLISLGLEFLAAVRWHEFDKMEEFLDEDFPVNFQDPRTLETAMHIATEFNNERAIRMLLETEKCDLLIKDRIGRLPVSNLLLAKGVTEELGWDVRTASEAQARERGIDFATYHRECIEEFLPHMRKSWSAFPNKFEIG